MAGAEPAKAAERAVELFLSGWNCSESVLMAVAEQLGFEGEWIPRVATAFGGGIARTGQVCGAISGALIALGWARGRDSSEQAPDEVHACGRRFLDGFLQRFPSTSCRMLIDIDLADPAEKEKAEERGVFRDQCSRFVAFCAGEMVTLLSE